MTYDPRTYWHERAIRQGPAYVGPGGHEARSDREARLFRVALRMAFGDETFGHVLDFGCGSGRMAPFLAEHCERYTGADISEPGILYAADRNVECASFVWLDGETLPLPDASVDLIVATVVFQHIPPTGFGIWTSELRRVLKPDGQALVIDSNPVDEPYPHMHPRTPEQVGEALGMDVVSTHDIGRHWLARYA